MVIQCDQCKTRFRLDDAKLQGGSAKVRCSKCRHVFIVCRESPAEESLFNPAVVEGGPAVPGQQASSGLAAATGAESAREAETESAAVEEAAGFSRAASPPTGGGGFGFGEFAFEEEEEPPPTNPEPEGTQPPAAAADGGFDFDEFAAAAPDEAPEHPAVEAAEEKAIDFDDFAFASATEQTGGDGEEAEFAIDFGDLALSDDSSLSAGGPPRSGRGEAGFTGSDGLLGESLGLGGDLAGTIPPESGNDGLDLAFADEIDFSGQAATEAAAKPAADEFGELDFGDLAMPEETATAAVESFPSPAAPPRQAAVTPAEEEKPAAFLVQAGEELPPLSIPSRRKGGTLFPTAVVAVAAAVVIALTGFGFYFLSGPEAFSKIGLGFLVEWAGLKPQEEGAISVRGVTGSYVVNKEGGELFVVKGQVVNNYRKPRASIQVKGLLYDGKGEVLLQKTAYCGNDLTTEQLKALPLVKINEAMNNQFGDSLANLGVQPDRAIPFVLVFDKVPREAADFGVQVAGSTVAAQ